MRPGAKVLEVGARYGQVTCHLSKLLGLTEADGTNKETGAKLVTAPESKVSSGMCSRFRPHLPLLLQYWERSVVTWGHPKYGGDSSAVQDQLKNVQQIQSDGSVIAWGSPISGGDSSRVQGQLRTV